MQDGAPTGNDDGFFRKDECIGCRGGIDRVAHLGEWQEEGEREFNSIAFEKVLQLEGFKGDMLGRNKQFAGEGGFGRPAAQGFRG